MNLNRLQSIQLGAICFGSLIGAGFASGKEIWIYFARFGWGALPLITLAGILMYFITKALLNWGCTHKIDSISQMNKQLFHSPIVGEILFIICNLILLSAMFAGSNAIGELLFTQFGKFLCALTGLICITFSLFKFKNMMKINLIIVPLLLIIIILALVISLKTPLIFTAPTSLFSPIWALVYLCANMYIVSFIFAKLGAHYPPTTYKTASIICAALFILFASFITVILLLNPESATSPLPLLNVLTTQNHLVKATAIIVIWLSILSTAVTITYTLTHYISKLHPLLASSLICTFSLGLSNLGFSFIIQYFYFLIGIIGAVLVIKLIKNSPS